MRMIFLLLSILISFSASLHADAYDHAQVVAVQDRAYMVRKEISVHAGVLPLDAFNKSFIAGASYTYGWKPQWSWEVLNVSAALNQETTLKKDLQSNFNVQPKGILDYATSIVSTQINYSPLYGKYLLFNDKVVHNELSFGLTAGAVQYKTEGSVPILGAGIMSRYYRSEGSSIKFDARLLYQMSNKQSSDLVLYFTLGYSIHLDASKGGSN